MSMWSLQAICQNDSLEEVFSIRDSLLVDGDSVSNQTIDSSILESKTISDNLAFVDYLISSELFSDALFVLEQVENTASPNPIQLDSIHYYKGWINYYNRNFELAVQYFENVHPRSKVYTASCFYRATCLTYEGKTHEAKALIEDLDVPINSTEYALKLLELSGLALLERNYADYDSLSQISVTNFLVASELEALKGYYTDMTNYKRKSPLLAGFLSAIVPGLGKFYVGYRGIPFGAFALTVPLAALAIETLIIAGVTGIPFLIAAPIFAVFYIGNIWGSILSVYSHEKEFYDEMDHNIIYDMHIPLRRVFN